MAIGEELSGFVRKHAPHPLLDIRPTMQPSWAMAFHRVKTAHHGPACPSTRIQRVDQRAVMTYGALAADIPLNVSFCMPAPVCAI